MWRNKKDQERRALRALVRDIEDTLESIDEAIDQVLDVVRMYRELQGDAQPGEPSLAQKIQDGTAFVMGVDPSDPSRVVVAEQVVDDGGVPTQSEINAVLRSGICDNPNLVGRELVLYETDRRGGKAYWLPALVTCVQRTHVDLPLLRSAEESDMVVAIRGKGAPTMIVPGHAARNDDGYYVERNPLPIPLDGTVHLHVVTPGEQGAYRELSVPYDPTGQTPRSWRFHPDHVPF